MDLIVNPETSEVSVSSPDSHQHQDDMSAFTTYSSSSYASDDEPDKPPKAVGTESELYPLLCDEMEDAEVDSKAPVGFYMERVFKVHRLSDDSRLENVSCTCTATTSDEMNNKQNPIENENEEAGCSEDGLESPQSISEDTLIAMDNEEIDAILARKVNANMNNKLNKDTGMKTKDNDPCSKEIAVYLNNNAITLDKKNNVDVRAKIEAHIDIKDTGDFIDNMINANFKETNDKIGVLNNNEIAERLYKEDIVDIINMAKQEEDTDSVQHTNLETSTNVHHKDSYDTVIQVETEVNIEGGDQNPIFIDLRVNNDKVDYLDIPQDSVESDIVVSDIVESDIVESDIVELDIVESDIYEDANETLSHATNLYSETPDNLRKEATLLHLDNKETVIHLLSNAEPGKLHCKHTAYLDNKDHVIYVDDKDTVIHLDNNVSDNINVITPDVHLQNQKWANNIQLEHDGRGIIQNEKRIAFSKVNKDITIYFEAVDTTLETETLLEVDDQMQTVSHFHDLPKHSANSLDNELGHLDNKVFAKNINEERVNELNVKNDTSFENENILSVKDKEGIDNMNKENDNAFDIGDIVINVEDEAITENMVKEIFHRLNNETTCSMENKNITINVKDNDPAGNMHKQSFNQFNKENENVVINVKENEIVDEMQKEMTANTNQPGIHTDNNADEAVFAINKEITVFLHSASSDENIKEDHVKVMDMLEIDDKDTDIYTDKETVQDMTKGIDKATTHAHQEEWGVIPRRNRRIKTKSTDLSPSSTPVDDITWPNCQEIADEAIGDKTNLAHALYNETLSEEDDKPKLTEISEAADCPQPTDVVNEIDGDLSIIKSENEACAPNTDSIAEATSLVVKVIHNNFRNQEIPVFINTSIVPTVLENEKYNAEIDNNETVINNDRNSSSMCRGEVNENDPVQMGMECHNDDGSAASINKRDSMAQEKINLDDDANNEFDVCNLYKATSDLLDIDFLLIDQPDKINSFTDTVDIENKLNAIQTDEPCDATKDTKDIFEYMDNQDICVEWNNEQIRIHLDKEPLFSTENDIEQEYKPLETIEKANLIVPEIYPPKSQENVVNFVKTEFNLEEITPKEDYDNDKAILVHMHDDKAVLVHMHDVGSDNNCNKDFLPIDTTDSVSDDDIGPIFPELRNDPTPIESPLAESALHIETTETSDSMNEEGSVNEDIDNDINTTSVTVSVTNNDCSSNTDTMVSIHKREPMYEDVRVASFYIDSDFSSSAEEKVPKNNELQLRVQGDSTADSCNIYHSTCQKLTDIKQSSFYVENDLTTNNEQTETEEAIGRDYNLSDTDYDASSDYAGDNIGHTVNMSDIQLDSTYGMINLDNQLAPMVINRKVATLSRWSKSLHMYKKPFVNTKKVIMRFGRYCGKHLSFHKRE